MTPSAGTFGHPFKYEMIAMNDDLTFGSVLRLKTGGAAMTYCGAADKDG